MATPQPFTTPPFKNGIVREAAVDQLIVPQDSVQMAVNVHIDRIGAVMRRPGITKLDDTISSDDPILGMGAFRNNAGTIKAVLAKADTNIYANTGSGWNTVRTGLTSGTTRARFTNLVDYTFMVDGNTVAGGSALQTWP